MADVDLTSPRGRADQPAPTESSIGQLLGRLADDFGDLVSTQIELAKVELKEDAGRAARGAGMFGAAAISSLLALSLLSWAAAWLLDDVMPRPLAFLIIGAVWTVAAAVLYSSGRNQLDRMRLAPQTKATLKEDVQWAKQQAS